MTEDNKNKEFHPKSRREYLQKRAQLRAEKRKKQAIIKIAVFSVIIFIAATVSATVLIIKANNIARQASNEIIQATEMPIVTAEPTIVTKETEDVLTAIITPQPMEKQPSVGGGRGEVIVLDAGHGKSSSEMSSAEKTNEGYTYNDSTGSWGEWRHYKSSTSNDCFGSGCTKTGPGCWYSMGNADRDIEPEITLKNAMAAKRYLEGMGYTVRMTRTSNEQNPSMNKRVSYCFPNNDSSFRPDASLYVCIHSNAGGGSGTSYIALEDTYTQQYIPSNFTSSSNTAGRIINSSIAQNTSLSDRGSIGGEGYLILFNKVPVPIAYLEIGFYDNSSDLSILRSESDAIGKGIADGVNQYLSSK